MRTIIRSFVLLPALVLALIAIPSVVMSAAGGHASAAAMSGLPGDVNRTGQSDLGQGTVPDPTPRPIPPMPVPGRPKPPPPPTSEPHRRPTPTATPTATPLPAPSDVKMNTFTITKVIGDRLSPTIYAYASNGWLYRSDQNGAEWYLVSTTPLVNGFIMNAADPNVLYSGDGVNCSDTLATIAPMYKSVDGGQNWSELTSGINMKPILTNQGNPDGVFAIDCRTIYLSTDGGQTWTAKPADPASNVWQTYVPLDIASSSLAGNPPPDVPQWDQLFAIGNNWKNESLIAFSGDLGDTWASITDPEESPQQAKVVTANLVEGGTIWVVYAKGVRSTADYGVHWTFTNKGLTNLTKAIASPLNDLTYGTNGKLYLATDTGLFEKSVQGDTWVRVSADGNGVTYDFDGAKLVGLLLTESDPSKLWINALVKNPDGAYAEAVFTYTVR